MNKIVYILLIINHTTFLKDHKVEEKKAAFPGISLVRIASWNPAYPQNKVTTKMQLFLNREDQFGNESN